MCGSYGEAVADRASAIVFSDADSSSDSCSMVSGLPHQLCFAKTVGNS